MIWRLNWNLKQRSDLICCLSWRCCIASCLMLWFESLFWCYRVVYRVLRGSYHDRILMSLIQVEGPEWLKLCLFRRRKKFKGIKLDEKEVKEKKRFVWNFFWKFRKNTLCIDGSRHSFLEFPLDSRSFTCLTCFENSWTPLKLLESTLLLQPEIYFEFSCQIKHPWMERNELSNRREKPELSSASRLVSIDKSNLKHL